MDFPRAIPDASPLWLVDAAVPRCLLDDAGDAGGELAEDRDGLVRVDLRIADGRIDRVVAHARASVPAAGEARAGLAGCPDWPCYADNHTHLGKGEMRPRAANADGTFAGALAATHADRGERWNADDVEARFEFGLRAAYAHGTSAIRTHLDSLWPQHRISWPVFTKLRERWRGRIALQAVTIVRLDLLEGPFGDELADIVADAGGILGAVIPADESGALGPDALGGQLDRIFALAARRGLELDFHADESGNAGSQALRAIAEAKLRHGFARNVVVGHCCSLAVQPPDEAERTLEVVARAGLAIVSLPMCNRFLQDRVPGRTPRWRGVTLLHELRARGIRVTVASDNCRDPFYGYGDHDMLEVFREAARIAHLDRPVGGWPAAVTRTPCDVMGLPHRGRIAAGAPADLVVFNARGYSELLSRPQSDRVVLRDGRKIDTTLPDYRELDPLMQGPP
jgi:cytosine deaminase